MLNTKWQLVSQSFSQKILLTLLKWLCDGYLISHVQFR